MNDELKPCPFCGGKAEFEYYWWGESLTIKCTNCGASTDTYCYDNEAMDAWNKRAQPTFTPDELDGIRQMFECRYPRPQQLSVFETTIINKCKEALKGECE